MSILELEFTDKAHGWSLAKTKFSDLNLLVGYSGAGKTRILNAIRTVRRAALRGAEFAAGCSWAIKVKAGAVTYNWRVSISASEFLDNTEDLSSVSAAQPIYLLEELSIDSGEILVSRTADIFLFRNLELPRLNQTESAISLLRDESIIAPMYTALMRVTLSRVWDGVFVTAAEKFLESSNGRFPTIDRLRESEVVNLILRSLILQNEFPESFQSVCNDYMDIFPTVTDVQIVNGKYKEYSHEMIMFGIKERDVDRWILASDMSSGMLRTLTQLFEMELAPPGTVILIDEVENSLGVNCLSAVIDRVNLHARDLQFILTSHHPYIINNIKPKDWRVVMRNGSEIFVKNGDELPALQGGSAQDQFIRLINSQEFEDGLG